MAMTLSCAELRSGASRCGALRLRRCTQADRRSVLLRSRLLIAEHVTRTTANVLSVQEIVARVHAYSPQVWFVHTASDALGASYRSAVQHIPRAQQSAVYTTVVAHGLGAHCCAALKTTRKGHRPPRNADCDRHWPGCRRWCLSTALMRRGCLRARSHHSRQAISPINPSASSAQPVRTSAVSSAT